MHSAFILTIVEIYDADAFARYQQAVAPVNNAIGGEAVMRGRTVEFLIGSGAKNEAAIAIGFPSIAAASAYIKSEEYQALEQLRQAAGNFNIRILG